MSVLVTGGAGYIGSHVTFALADRGEGVVVLDNLSTGLKSLVSPKARFVEGDTGDRRLVGRLLNEHGIESVIHFAGSIVVPESVAKPLDYYANNVVASRSLIAQCIESNVRHFIFSSTATVYSESAAQPLKEDAPKAPISPYARSKLMTEWILEDVSMAHPSLRHIVLRYFNVAGADPQGRTGQSTPNATHLIKRACQVALGRLPHLDIFGTDYPTPDGTGIRDYIHVSDLAEAHLLALDALRDGAVSTVYNCGYGKGLSVHDIVAGVSAVIGRELPRKESPRRAGDPAILISEPARIRQALGWQPKHADLSRIIGSALAWEEALGKAD